MNKIMKCTIPFIVIAASSFAQESCIPQAPQCFTHDPCEQCYCLGPENIIANAPVCPRTCNGDFSIQVAALYWRADEEGLEYAVDTAVNVGSDNSLGTKNLIDAHYLTPNFKWNFGFRLGARYCSTCDGWDLGIDWTSFHGKASSHVEAEIEDNHALYALWSAFQPITDGNAFQDPIVSDIKTNWNLDLNLIDLILGRDFWVSRLVAVKPFIGLRYASVNQNYELEYNGADFSFAVDRPKSDHVDLKDYFRGAGVLAGLNTHWHFGCGWSLYGNLAASIVYGRFDIGHQEFTRLVESPFFKQQVLKTEDHLRLSRGILDLGLGIEYAALVCDCKYGISAKLGWEQHLFFHQNQMWRVNRLLATGTVEPVNDGENDHTQQRGTLSTSGWILSFRFDF